MRRIVWSALSRIR